MADNSSSNSLKKELTNIILLLAGLCLIFQLVFNKGSLGTNITAAASVYWLFILPGFAIMYWWQESLDFVERVIIGSVIGFAVIGVGGYYIGLLGIHTRFHSLILPPIMILIGLIGLKRARKRARAEEKKHIESNEADLAKN